MAKNGKKYGHYVFLALGRGKGVLTVILNENVQLVENLVKNGQKCVWAGPSIFDFHKNVPLRPTLGVVSL